MPPKFVSTPPPTSKTSSPGSWAVCALSGTILPVWKAGEYPWLKEADSQALQMALRHLDQAYTNFFAHRAHFPQFKKKHAGRQSYAYPQRVKINGDKVFLPKIGWVKAVVHREISGTIKTVTVSRSATGKYYAAILTEDGKALPEPIRHMSKRGMPN